ncbi:MICOS complex subunit mic19 [Sphaceloma murrayae]|uniref:MICOS complex subunit mic19 n=1 Tax=Sphaceloma murrayae TaxID=2082308 RepID=A0A2K1QHX9_9PEZI|nr:MICOS complex subunit mic19 [Sphaceloma murrayae]
MGNGGSKQVGDSSQHVFSAETPVRFSQQVLDQLQQSPDTDSTRAHTLELQIQQRVQTELQRIRDIEASRLVDLTASLTPTSDDHPSSSPSSSSSEDDQDSDPSLTTRISTALGASPEPEKTHSSVKSEIEKMKAKLEQRRTLEKPTAEVEKAKDQLVQCLRMNDRRPLDCWKEVEEFKGQVGRLEKGFVERSLK